MQVPANARLTRTCALWYDGLVCARFHDRAEVTLDDARENLATTAALTGGHRAPVLVDLRPIRSQTAEARAHFAGPAATAVTLAVALVDLEHQAPLLVEVGQVHLLRNDMDIFKTINEGAMKG